MFKKINLYILLLIAIVVSGQSINAQTTNIPLVLDTPDTYTMPGNFRTTWGPLPADMANINKQGFLDIDMAGSAQFSQQQLLYVIKNVFNELPKTYKITIVDLRQESHGFIDGNAVSWYGQYNWANLYKTNAQINHEEKLYLMKLAGQANINLKKPNSDQTVLSLKPSNVQTEEQLVKSLKQNNIDYVRFYIPANRLPKPEEIDRFISFYNSVPVSNAFVYFHDRDGAARDTFFMMLYDILWSGKQVRLKDIIERETLFSHVDLFKLPPATSYYYAYAVERANFIHEFYKYVQENGPDYKTSWTLWLAKQKMK